MKIAVIGATGTSGVKTVAHARKCGHDVIGFSRSSGIDLHTGEGLRESLTGCDVVIDTSQPLPDDPGVSIIQAFSQATSRLCDAAIQAHVPHLVFLSICNIDKPALNSIEYYVAKREQEKVILNANISSSIIRSSQWMEFATNPFAVTEKDDHVEVQDWLIQPIAVNSVAKVLVARATDQKEFHQIAGLEPVQLPTLTRRYLRARGDSRPVLSALPKLTELATGLLLAPPEAELIGPPVSEWLRTHEV